jgi:hypothetical protein
MTDTATWIFVVGLGILSLNQFAEYIDKAEALSDVIGSVFNGLREVEVSQTVVRTSVRRKDTNQRKAIKTLC